MSKKKQNDEDVQQQPAYVAELLLNGTTMLEAETRDGLAAMIDDLPAETRYSVGAVGRTATGTYTLRIDLMKP